MKRFELISLRIKNFKGIKDYTLTPAGKDLRIFGENGTGKTTLFDSFMWLLFGKDSKNRTDFDIKELDEDGNVKQHGLDHEVEGFFRIDGNDLTLKRVFVEKWTKPAGSSKKKFTGHTTNYFIDGVPKKQKEYVAKVNEIISENAFKLLTNPSYFNQNLNDKERRDILLEIAGDVSDEELANSVDNKDLKNFIEKLNGRSIEDHKSVIKAERNKINKELDKIPVRIDEVHLALPDVSGLNKTELEQDIQILERQIELHQEKINDIKSGGEVSNKRKELSDIELELVNIKNEHDQEGKQEIFDLKSKNQEIESTVSMLESKLMMKAQKVENNYKRVSDINESLKQLRTKWTEVNATEFEHNEQCECPTCGQELPEEQLAEARAKALENFNKEKSERMESMNKKGASLNAEIEAINEETAAITKEVEQIKSLKAEAIDQLEQLQKQLKFLQESVTDITDNPKYVEALKRKEAVQNEIVQLKESVHEAVEVVLGKILKLKAEKKVLENDLDKFDKVDRSNSRLVELEQQEQELAQKLEQLDHQLFLADEYTKSKVNLLEGKINSHFKIARFKMFENLVNGGINEICVTTYNGVPYNKGLNDGSRINVGLDIINTLNKHYGLYAPIFIDNAESVTKLYEMEAQTIALVVSKKHKQLEVETVEENRKSA